MPPKNKYTDPKLRDEVKEEIHNSDKGGAPGQWSARKAQMMASEYKKRGGDYTTEKSEKDESQKHLDDWGKEEWQTKEGDGNAKQPDGSEKRYLPKKAWDNMSEKEKKETDDKKLAESKEGKQYVENTQKAKQSRKKASQSERDQADDSAQEYEGAEKQTSEGDAGKDDEAADDKEGQEQARDDENGEEAANEDNEEEPTKDVRSGQKRGRKEKDDLSSKKQKSNAGTANGMGDKKTVGSKHMDAKEPAQQGSNDRLPKKGQKVQWKAMPGYVSGKVVEILKHDKEVDGKSFRASEREPKLVLKSDASGKICVHKLEACFYD